MKDVAGDVFSKFSNPVRRIISEKGFKKPTETQVKAIPLIEQRNNILLMAPTGTGKTESAFLPILNSLFIMNKKNSGIKAIYITPLRALNRDIFERLEWWCKRLDIRIAVRHGDTEISERTRHALVPPEILITTPETLQAILHGRVMRQHLSSIRWVIVDEVHELAGEKRGSQLSIGLEILRNLAEDDIQIIGLSATVGTPNEVAKFLVGVGRPCKVVEVSVSRSMQIEVAYPIPVKDDYRLASDIYTYPAVAARMRLIRKLIEASESSLIFTNTRTESEILANKFRVWDSNFSVGVHHGSLSKSSRVRAETLLKDGELRAIICTSSLELGIDIGDLDTIIQYNSPRQVTRLVQRIGRSGHRIGGLAKGIIITHDSDDTLEALVISRMALQDNLEPVDIPNEAFDVLIHQLAGLMLHKRKWYFDEALHIINKAYPYRSLNEERLLKVLDYMHERYPRLAWVSKEDKTFSKPMNVNDFYNFYFQNLSMIPDQKQYIVIQEDGSPVGVLDEAFVAEHGEVGIKFVEGGEVWKITQIYGSKIYVESQEDPSGAIPTWIGDEIPVPMEVSKEVGMIRRLVEEKVKGTGGAESAVQILGKKYRCSDNVLERSISEVIEQIGKNYPIPTDRIVTIEKWKDFIVINCCFGHRINRTLSRIIGYLLSVRIGASIGVHQDPYRMVIHSSIVQSSEIKSILVDLSIEDIHRLAVESFTKTGIFKRRLIHVAKKSGVLAKDANLSDVGITRLMEGLKDSIIYEEAIKTVLRTDLDLEATIDIIKKVSRGEIKVTVLEVGDELSPVSRIGMETVSRKSDIVSPERMRKIILESTKARLLNESRMATCTSCWKYYELVCIRDLVQGLKCSLCNSLELVFLDETEEKVRKLTNKILFSRKDVSNKLHRTITQMGTLGRLYMEYGFPAAIVSVARGLRHDDIEGILLKESNFNDKLIDDIIQAEKKSLKRKYFAY